MRLNLPLLDLNGKKYLEVKSRVFWFRKLHPDWSLETEILQLTDMSALAKAQIRNPEGQILATSHKFERIQAFPDFLEKAETGAIGRALALMGFGTQFYSEKEDSVLLSRDETAGNYQINFGRKYKGMRLREIPKADLDQYLKWLESDQVTPGSSLFYQIEYFKKAYSRFYPEPLKAVHGN